MEKCFPTLVVNLHANFSALFNPYKILKQNFPLFLVTLRTGKILNHCKLCMIVVRKTDPRALPHVIVKGTHLGRSLLFTFSSLKFCSSIRRPPISLGPCKLGSECFRADEVGGFGNLKIFLWCLLRCSVSISIIL